MNWNAVQITAHAWERFVTRWPGPNLPACPMFELLNLLTASVEEDIGEVGRAVRLINNGFQDARYFACDGWRFVLSPDGLRLITCERIIFKATKKKKFTARRRQRY